MSKVVVHRERSGRREAAGSVSPQERNAAVHVDGEVEESVAVEISKGGGRIRMSARQDRDDRLGDSAHGPRVHARRPHVDDEGRAARGKGPHGCTPPYAGARQLGHDAEILPGGGDGPEEGDGGGGSEEGTHLLLGSWECPPLPAPNKEETGAGAPVSNVAIGIGSQSICACFFSASARTVAPGRVPLIETVSLSRETVNLRSTETVSGDFSWAARRHAARTPRSASSMRPAVSASFATPVATSFRASPFAVAWSARNWTDFIDETSAVAASLPETSTRACRAAESFAGMRETSTSAH